ncbi:ATP-binding protein [Paenibacillus filicis]|uniref:histidine kinase n=1 Tax=Paenibacillus filicis TaxID=669464 RepID=A0ABU9DU84_9BACL
MILLLLGMNLITLRNWGDQPEAKNGLLDLSGWQKLGQEIVKLKGEWTFYPGQLLQRAEDAESSSASSVYTRVPGNWKPALADPQQEEALGYGTYRLQVRFGEHQTGLQAFRVQLIRAAHRLFVDGEEIGSNGRTTANPSDYAGQITPYVAFKDIKANQLDIFIQVANWDHAVSGGIIHSLWMGPPEKIVNEQQRVAAFEFGVIMLLLVFALYFGALQCFAPHNGWVYLSLFFLSAALLNADQGSRWLLAIWPDMPFRSAVNVSWLSSIALMLWMFMFIHTRHPRRIHRFFSRGVWLFSLLMAFSIIVLPMTLSTRLVPAWVIVAVMIYVYLLVSLFASLRRGDHQTHYEFWAYCLFAGQSLLNSFLLFGFIEFNILYVIQMAAFSTAILLLFLFQFFRIYARTKALTVELQRLNRFKSEFMSGMSEQMITPLNAIISTVNMRLETDHALNPQQVNDLRLIASVGWTMRHLVDELMDFSRLREEGIVLVLRPVHLSAIMDDVIARVSDLIFSDSIRLVNGMPPDLPPVMADEQRTQQILNALMQVALKVTVEGSISASAAATQDRIHLELVLSGTGITKETGRSLSQLLLRRDSYPLSRPAEGLGLYLAHALVELHQGQLSIESAGAQVLKLSVTLPIAKEASLRSMTLPEERLNLAPMNGLQESGTRRQNQEHEAGMAEILIIHDDPISLHALVNILSMDAYRVTVVRGGREALDKLYRLQRVDLVIVDRILQDMSGLEICRHIRKHFTLFELPILLLTSGSFPDHAITASQAGANDCIAKPVEASELRVRVRTLIQLKHSVGERIRMELAFLQAQIKPHFLFNTLNSIAALSKRQPESMTKLLTDFGFYLRESFRFDNSEPLVSFERELNLVKSYLQIEKVRFEDWLTFDIEVLTSERFLIPPLTLQPLVENAVRHGIMRRADGGFIHIRVFREREEIRIQVKDNGVGMTAELLERVRHSSPSGGIGIANIERRMRQMFGHGLILSSEPGQGTEILIRLPLEKVGSYENHAG